MTPRVFGLIALLPLGACGLYSPVAPEQRAAMDTCRSDAERVFNTQHRDQLAQRDSTDSPFSGDTLPSDPNRGLSDQYEHEQMVDRCLRGDTGPAGAPIPAMTDTTPQH